MAGYKQFIFCLLLAFLSLAPMFAWSSEVPTVLKLFSAEDPSEIHKGSQNCRFLHMVYRVGDLNRSIEFYTASFGMQLFETVDRPLLQYTYAVVGCPDAHIFFKLIHDYGVDSIDVHTPRFNYRTLGVISRDTKKTVDYIVANGGVVESRSTYDDGFDSIIVLDPSGYSIEITDTNRADPSMNKLGGTDSTQSHYIYTYFINELD